ncbi:MAG TPA: GspE/PulE family protein [Vitreimonas sp.]|nr:GspE/PulE family protein [Vitreimonas sp.]
MLLPYDPAQLLASLQELNLIEETALQNAYQESTATNLPFDQILLRLNLISDENLGKVIAELIGIPYVHLSHVHIPAPVLNLIPETFAKKHHVIVYQNENGQVAIATSHPQNLVAQEFIKRAVNAELKVAYTTQRELTQALSLYTPDIKSVITPLIETKSGEQPIIEIVDNILGYGYKYKASDIHIEPIDEYSLVRMRIDGVLHDSLELPIKLHEQVVTRIKVLAKLRTDEHQAAQDGKLQFDVDEEPVDVRVSIVPITNGEKIVMRLLSKQAREYSLQDLGISSSDLDKINRAYEKPYGMILSTGPTGSGKTTSLYTILKMVNKRDINIMTIEDPVEYTIAGINQIQVNTKTNLTFAAGLRSIVRQDPNVILVGEIRDEETAGIAVNAAMTGHLVLSTLHTNNAATAIPRLLDMEVEPFLVASSINVIIAQRLVRKTCLRCRVSKEVTLSELSSKTSEQSDGAVDQMGEAHFTQLKHHFDDQEKIRVYEGKGCEVCHHTGYVGRIGIFEVLEITEEIRQAITDRQDAGNIQTLAMKQGMTTMFEDGLEKMKQGQTTLAEILRVTKE